MKLSYGKIVFLLLLLSGARAFAQEPPLPLAVTPEPAAPTLDPAPLPDAGESAPAALPTAQPAALPMNEPSGILPESGIVPLIEPVLPSEQVTTDTFVADSSILPVAAEAQNQAAPTSRDLEMVTELSTEAVAAAPKKLNFNAGVGYYFEDNIFLSPTNPTSDQGLQYSGRLQYNWFDGEKFKFRSDITYSAVHLDEWSELNSSKQDGQIFGEYAVGKNQLNFDASYSYAAGVDRRVGTLNNRTSYGGNVQYKREIGARTNLLVSSRYSNSEFEGLLSNQDLLLRSELNYLFGSKTRLGVALVYGSLVTKSQGGQTFLADGRAAPGFSQLSIDFAKQQGRQLAANAELLSKQASEIQRRNQNNLAAAEKLLSDATARRKEVEGREPEDPVAVAAAKLDEDDAKEIVARANEGTAAATDQANTAKANAKAARAASKRQTRRSSDTPDQTYYQTLLTAQYEVTDKISLMASAGLDFRSYTGPEAAPSSNDYTFSLTGAYQPRQKTTLSITALRNTVGAVALQGTSIDRTMFGGMITQQIGEKFKISLSGNYEIDAYQSIRTDVFADRRDENMSSRLELNYALTKHVGLRAFWEMDINDSQLQPINYDNNRYGLQVGVSF
jgi:hypothetical protein